MTKALHNNPTQNRSSIRPTLLGHPKYRHKEGKRNLMKMTCRKLKSLEDPESVLCKAVLINNTLKYLQNSTININAIQSQTLQLPNDLRVESESTHKSQEDLDILNNEIVFPHSDNINSENEQFLDISPPLEDTELKHQILTSNDSSLAEKIFKEKGSDIVRPDQPPCGVCLNNSYSVSNCDTNSDISLYCIPLHRVS